jgi:hypothetical protein
MVDHEEGIRDVTVLNPGAKHSISVGMCNAVDPFRGSLGYFGLGIIDGPRSSSRAASAGRCART